MHAREVVVAALGACRFAVVMNWSLPAHVGRDTRAELLGLLSYCW